MGSRQRQCHRNKHADKKINTRTLTQTCTDTKETGTCTHNNRDRHNHIMPEQNKRNRNIHWRTHNHRHRHKHRQAHTHTDTDTDTHRHALPRQGPSCCSSAAPRSPRSAHGTPANECCGHWTTRTWHAGSGVDLSGCALSVVSALELARTSRRTCHNRYADANTHACHTPTLVSPKVRRCTG